MGEGRKQGPNMIERISDRLNVAVGVLLMGFAAYAYFEREKEVQCLARNIYFESLSEPQAGKEAVGIVTLLRTVSEKFPNSVCGVVYEPRQFSWTLNPAKLAQELSGRSYERIHEIARRLYALRHDTKGLVAEAQRLGLTPDTVFYKRFDWNENNPEERRMSDSSKWFFRECLEPVLDSAGQHLRHGAHVFYRAKPGICPRPTAKRIKEWKDSFKKNTPKTKDENNPSAPNNKK